MRRQCGLLVGIRFQFHISCTDVYLLKSKLFSIWLAWTVYKYEYRPLLELCHWIQLPIFIWSAIKRLCKRRENHWFSFKNGCKCNYIYHLKWNSQPFMKYNLPCHMFTKYAPDLYSRPNIQDILKSIFILSTHLCLIIPRGFFILSCPANIS